jgi:hypothetical protein
MSRSPELCCGGSAGVRRLERVGSDPHQITQRERGQRSVCWPFLARSKLVIPSPRQVSSTLCDLSLKHSRRLAHLVDDVHVKRAALRADTALDAGRGFDRELCVPLLDLLDPSGWHLVQVPDHPPDLDPFRTRQAVLTVVCTKDTSC